jgi:diacylglycerol kinase (ATP)
MKKEFIIKTSSFSIHARLRSVKYAFEGLISFFSEQHNAIIHFVMTGVVLAAAIFFQVTKTEAIAIVLAIAFVWTAELFNTAVEKLADMVSEEYHPSIKFIKDVSAAAVLISAIAAFIVGLVVFLPKIL